MSNEPIGNLIFGQGVYSMLVFIIDP